MSISQTNGVKIDLHLPLGAVLIATHNRFALLNSRVLPSINQQSQLPNQVLIINDGHPFTENERNIITSSFKNLIIQIIDNDRTQGLAGALNTGLMNLRNRKFKGFVAIIDDDDEWDPDHLECNLTAIQAMKANISISGLRFYKKNKIKPRPILKNVTDKDFLVGNPGWQGSNTFVSFKLLIEVGGFREGLQSLNDRDLAIRLLRSPNAKVAFTGKWTATWYMEKDRKSLSCPVSPKKIAGLRWFWKIYGDEMTSNEKDQFFERAKKLWGITQETITKDGPDLPDNKTISGGLFH